VGWHAVDGEGRDPATGRVPAGAGAASPAGALLAVPVATWPLHTCADDGRTATVATALGPGGARVTCILERLATAPPPPADLAVDALARATPAGVLDLPVARVAVDDGARAAAGVDPAWMGHVDRCRFAARDGLRAAGRETELEAALNLAMLLGTERVDRDAGEGPARVASGARLWLLGAAVAWALAVADGDGDPFEAWAELVSFGMWPVGPVGGRLVVSEPLPCRRP
jgi:hypothetical protein